VAKGLKPEIDTLARWRAYEPLVATPEYWSLCGQTANVGCAAPVSLKNDRDRPMQQEELAEFCAATPDRFVAFATVALQHPDLAVEQLQYAIKTLGLRLSVGGSVAGQELADPKFHPVWAKAEELGILIFMHPLGTRELEPSGRLKGSGLLTNTIGNSLETTIALSHLIFEGTLDRFPG
jgi:aminocarboxymuconate-semialdehyde decarboxylase